MSSKSRKNKLLLGIPIAAVLIILIGAVVIFFSSKDIYTTTDVKVVDATVVTREISDNIYYLQVNVPTLTDSPLWVETTSDFYQQANPGQSVGALVGSVDTYHVKKSLDRSQLKIKYSATNWEVLSIYPSLADAQNENQPKTFTTTATLKQRIKSLDGRYFFLFDAGGKRVMAEVSNEYYQSYKPQVTPNDSFELEFAGTGDFNHLVRIVKP